MNFSNFEPVDSQNEDSKSELIDFTIKIKIDTNINIMLDSDIINNLQSITIIPQYDCIFESNKLPEDIINYINSFLFIDLDSKIFESFIWTLENKDYLEKITDFYTCFKGDSINGLPLSLIKNKIFLFICPNIYYENKYMLDYIKNCKFDIKFTGTKLDYNKKIRYSKLFNNKSIHCKTKNKQLLSITNGYVNKINGIIT